MSSFSDTNNIPAAISQLSVAGNRAAMEVAQEIVKRIEEGFRKGQDALGRPWAPLSPETVRRKGNSRILIESGDLSSSFTAERTMTGARVISRNPLAALHENGLPERGMPARPILGPAEIWARQNAIDNGFLSRIFRFLTSILL